MTIAQRVSGSVRRGRLGLIASALLSGTVFSAPWLDANAGQVQLQQIGPFDTESGAFGALVALGVLNLDTGTKLPPGTIVNVVEFETSGPTPVTKFKIVYTIPSGNDPDLATASPLGSNPINSIYGLSFTVSNTSDFVVAGTSDTDAGTFHAVQWTLSKGTRDLGTLLGGAGNSAGFGVSGDGNAVVGWSNNIAASASNPFPTGQHAFRWTLATGMVDLGSLAGTTGTSFANGTNGDGSVVVGTTDIPQASPIFQPGHAFRWTQAGGMQDIGSFGPTVGSVAYAVNPDGSVVVGSGAVTTGGQHAFKWTQAGGMQDLGTVPGIKTSVATALSADGSVIVGIADPNGVQLGFQGWGISNNSRAFRWTQATGMQDLNAQLAAGGVIMTGITLLSATSVTQDGQFITGQAILPQTTPGLHNGYLARFCDATIAAACSKYNALVAANSPTTPTTPTTPTGPVVVGLTTQDSVQQSIDQLGDERLRLMAQQHGLAAELLGANLPIGTGTELGIYGSAGSAAGGTFGRIAFGNGLAFLAGLSYQNAQYNGVELKDAALGAAALRYVVPTSGWWRPFAEVGSWAAINGSMTFSRNYINGAGTAIGGSSTSGWVGYLYGRLGSAFAVSLADEFAVSVEVGREWLQSGAYSEAMSSSNPFQAAALGATDTLDIVKARAQWTHIFTPAIDTTLWIASATPFNRASELQVSVPGFGTIASSLPHTSWGEYGARVGYKLTTSVTADVFADGVFGDHTIGSTAHVGADLRYRF